VAGGLHWHRKLLRPRLILNCAGIFGKRCLPSTLTTTRYTVSKTTAVAEMATMRHARPSTFIPCQPIVLAYQQ
jgi:hypothetical protein